MKIYYCSMRHFYQCEKRDCENCMFYNEIDNNEKITYEKVHKEMEKLRKDLGYGK